MFQILKKYKAAIYFILRFFVVYVILTLLYYQFLSDFKSSPDSITELVAEQSRKVVAFFNYKTDTAIVAEESFVRFYINETYIARIVEGCNGISVYILYISFIIAFRGSLKHTLLFVVLGSIFLYFTNILRVGVLIIGLYKFPENAEFLHQIVFPVLIYGMVFLLWILWVNKFAKK